MGLQRSLEQNMDLSFASLKEAKSYMNDAAQTASDEQLKAKLQDNLKQVNQLLSECENMAQLLKDQG